MKLPYSQFWTTTAQALQSYPMYGSYTKENGNKLIFDDAFAVLDVALTGSAEIASVKVASPTKKSWPDSPTISPPAGASR